MSRLVYRARTPLGNVRRIDHMPTTTSNRTNKSRDTSAARRIARISFGSLVIFRSREECSSEAYGTDRNLQLLAPAARKQPVRRKSLGPAGVEADQRAAVVVADHLGAAHVARGAAHLEDVLEVAAGDVEERLADARAVESRLDDARLAIGVVPGEVQPARDHRVEPVQVAVERVGRGAEE